MKERAQRYVRRLEVACYEKGGDRSFTGYTLNISETGMFIACSRTLPAKTRIRVEIKGRDTSIWLEGIVMRERRTRPELQRVKPGGIAVRFLNVEELVRELIPTREKVPERPEKVRGGTVPGEAPVQQKTLPGERIPLEVELRRRGEILLIVSQEIREGGMFIRTQRNLEVGQKVLIEVSLQGSIAPPAKIKGSVTERISPEPAEPGADDTDSNLVAGVSVQLDDPEAAEAVLMGLVGGALSS